MSIKVIFKNDFRRKIRYIPDSDYDPNTMELLKETKEEKIKASINLRDMIKSNKAPGIKIATRGVRERPSVTHNGKLDSGAARELLDEGLKGAKIRAIARNKRIGSSYRKMHPANKTKLKGFKGRKR